MGAYDEWTVIYDPLKDVSETSPELVELACRAALRAMSVDLGPIAARATRDAERYELAQWPGHHYRLLTAIAEVTEAKRVVEIGTYAGASALAFLSAPSIEMVTSYDLKPWFELEFSLLSHEDFSARLEQHIADLADDAVFQIHRTTLLAADIIFLDGPKDGIFEQAFLTGLSRLPRQKTQLLILDDVKVNTMVKIWQSFPYPKLDAASFGHWSGTGLAWLPISFQNESSARQGDADDSPYPF